MSAATQFAAETAEHQLTVLHDDGPYRHLRFARPGTGLWSFDLVIWPWHISITGDIGSGYTFSAREDMFDFFSARSEINPHYWIEKLPTSQLAAARQFSPDKLRDTAIDHIDQWGLAARDRARAVAKFDSEWEEVSAWGDPDSHQEVLDAFEFAPTITNGRVDSSQTLRFHGSSEWSCQDFDHHFLLACHAIVFGVRAYQMQKDR